MPVLLISVLGTWGYSFAVAFVILKVIDMIMGLHVSPDDELLGLDVSQHSELAHRH